MYKNKLCLALFSYPDRCVTWFF